MATIQYYLKEETNTILVSGSSTRGGMNALLTSSKNAEAVFDPNLTAKISSLGMNTSYIVQNQQSADTIIPIEEDQELWVYRGYNTNGGDGLTYRYNPHAHRGYKAYILTETGSGIPGYPYSPTGSALNFTTGSLGYDIPSKYIERRLDILGNNSPNTPTAISGSFIVYDDTRDIHPFIWTQYTNLGNPPADGANISVYKQNLDANFTGFEFNTATNPNAMPSNPKQIRFNQQSATSVNTIWFTSTQETGQVFGPLISVLADGLIPGTLRIQQDPSVANNFIDYTIQSITAPTGINTYYTIGVTGATPGSGFSAFTQGQDLQMDLNNYPQRQINLLQPQNFALNVIPQLNDSVTLRTGSYSYTSSQFQTTDNNGNPASGSTMFGLYADYDHYAAYNIQNTSPPEDSPVTLNYIGDQGSLDARFITVGPGSGSIITALVGSPTASGYLPNNTNRLNTGEYTGNRYEALITNPSRPGVLPNDIFATRWSDAYISFSSSLSSSLDGLYVFNQLPQNDIQVTASVLLAPWTGSDSGSKYGVDEYSTAKYGEGETGEGPTWMTASLRIYTGSYPLNVPNTTNAYLTESIYQSKFIHTQSAGVPFTMSFTIPSESISIKDCLSMALAVSSGSYDSGSVENSLVVRNYSLEFFTPTQSGQGDGRVPTLIENAFSGTLGFTNTADCQPLFNNVSQERENQRIQLVEAVPTASGYGGYQPLNFFPILSGSAEKSTVPESNYTQLSSLNNKYRGSRTTAADVNTINGLGGIDLFTRPDGSENGFGLLPVIDYQTAYFAYCDQVLDPYPVVNNVTQFNLKYLINDSGDALQPNLSPYTAFDVEGSWVESENARVGINQVSGSSQYDQLNGIQPVKYVAKEPVAVLWSQISSDNYVNAIPLAGAPGIVSTFTSSFLSYNMVAQGRNTNASNQNDKVIPLYNVLDQAATAGLFTYSTSSRYGFVASGTENQASSSIVSINSPAPNGNGGTGAGANVTAQYANTGELYFNKDYFAINDSGDTPPGFDYLLGNQLSDVYEISALMEFPSTMPKFYKTDNGGWNDSSDYNTSNIGEIYVKCQYTDVTGTADSGWVDAPMTMIENPILRGYFGNNQIIDIDLIQTMGSSNAGLKNNATQCWVKINPTSVKNAYQSQGIVHTDAEYCSFIFNVRPSNTNNSIRAQRRYRFVAYQNYTAENLEPVRNYWNPTTKPQYLGSLPLPAAASQGPYLTVRVESEQGVSNNVDGALNAPYWDFSSSISQSLPFTHSDALTLVAPNGNVNYGGEYYQQYLPYSSSANAQFPGGLEPTDTTIPAYNIPWTVEVGDQIKFQNTEAQVYTVLEVTPPENTADNRLVLKVDREIPASIQKDFFILRRFRYSPNTVILNSLFPYGGLKVDQVEKDNTQTDAITQFYDQDGNPVANGDTVYTQSMSSTSSVNPTFEYVERPLAKKDNTPSGILFPEFPTALIELEPDKVITDLRDKKLIT